MTGASLGAAMTADERRDEPAFPCPNYPTQIVESTGMTLRDYFAAKAMQALVNANWTETHLPAGAKWAYLMADAMLTERDR